MEWLVGIYLGIGVLKTISRFSNPNPALKPIWMSTEKDTFKIAFMFTIYTLFWPLV